MTCTATDSAGLTASGSTTVTVVDTIAPTVVRNPSVDSCTVPGNAGWCRGTQTAGFTASDGGSGVGAPPCPTAGVASCDFTVSSATNGPSVSIPSGPVSDVAGNTTPGIPAPGFRIDNVAPVISCPSPSLFTLGQSPATLTASVTDVTSGPANPTVSAVASTANVGPPRCR